MVMTFDTAGDAEKAVRKVVDAKGIAQLANYVILTEDDEENIETIAEGGDILAAMTRLRVLEEIRSTLATSFPHLNAEIGAILDSPSSADSNNDQISDTWLQGFLAAALHDVSIDMESGVVRIGKSLERPVSDLTSLKPTG
jgi:hypothetical protein